MMSENNPDNTEMPETASQDNGVPETMSPRNGVPETASPDNGVPEIEDAYDPTRDAETVVDEDDPHQPDPDPRTIEDGNAEAAADVDSTVDATTETAPAKAGADDSNDTSAFTDNSSDSTAIADDSVDATAVTVESSDTAAVADDSSGAADVADAREPDAKPIVPDWSNETSARRIIVELTRVESEVRTILEERDSRRKRKLGGTRRWLELEEDILAWRHSGRFAETALDRMHELIGKRHYLFKRLRFIAATRPTWNT